MLIICFIYTLTAIEASNLRTPERKKREYYETLSEMSEDIYSPDKLPPFVGGPDRRLDICNLGFLSLQRRIADTMSSAIFTADILPEQPSTVRDTPPRGKRARPEQRAQADVAGSGEITIDASTTLTAPRTVVVKYFNDCIDRKKDGPPAVHPLVPEYSLMATLNDTGIIPHVYYLSPGTLLPESDPSNRFRSLSLDRDYAACRALGTEVRFMVLEEVGQSVSSYVEMKMRDPGTDPRDILRIPIKIAIKSLELLKRFKAAGFVHGDIHGGNIAFKSPVVGDLDAAELVLIDFGYTFPFVDKVGSPVEQPRLKSIGTLLLSPWHISNQRTGPRDDVFRVYELLANWVSRGRLYKGLKVVGDANSRLVGNMQDRSYMELKMREPYFRHSFALASRMFIPQGVPGERAAEVMRTLEGSLQKVRQLDHPDSFPNYDDLITDLNRALVLIDTA
jgi:hypothetical protein